MDLTITPDAPIIRNVTTDFVRFGKWVGNYISPEPEVPEAHKSVLMQVKSAMRVSMGMSLRKINCGIDYIVSGRLPQ